MGHTMGVFVGGIDLPQCQTWSRHLILQFKVIRAGRQPAIALTTKRKHVSNSYTVRQIEPFDVDRAFPLVEPVAAQLSLADWRRFCARLALGGDRTSDLVWVACNTLGVIQGLALCRVYDGSDCRSLEVPLFVVTSASDDSGVSKELIGRLKDVATKAGCTIIRFWTLTPDNWSRWLDRKNLSNQIHGTILILDQPGSV